uniref:clostripain-related cysteine peptidase n=1 Tax=Butyrivibrio sp. MC2013 TaxID=1280686 RepID=UPI00041A28E1
METAMAVEPYADYMIASEETEPGTGWYYTSWLNALSKNSSIETIDLAKILVDDFTAASASASSRAKTTLSIIDLAEFKGVIPSVLGAFGQNLSSQIKSDNYQQVAQARSDTREFASSSHIDQIDLVNFCNNLGTNEALDLAKAVSGCVKYNKTYNVTNAYGMSVYFPYSSLKSVNNMVKIYDNLEVDDSYAESIKSFAQLESAGQIVTSQTSGSTGLFDVLMGGSSSTGSAQGGSIESILLQALMSGGSSGITSSSGGSAGYGSALTSFASILGGSQAGATAQADSLASLLGARAPITEEDLQLTNEGGREILKLAEDKWQEIDTVAINVFVDDGHGYIDMGLDNIASYDDDGDLIVDYDGDWLAVNGNMAAYYLSSDDYDEESGYYVTNGYIPAELNGERVNLLIEFSEKDPDGTILGAQKVYKNEETGEVTQAKGLIEPKDGDTLRLLCDYYKPDGSFDDSYYLGEPIEVSGEGMELMTLTMDNDKVYYNYRLTDYYGSNYWTPLRELAR